MSPPIMTTHLFLLLFVLASSSTTAAAFDCFTTQHDLYAAVDAVLWNRQRQAVSADYRPLASAVAIETKYGPQWSDWCFAPSLQNLSHTFSAQRNPLAAEHVRDDDFGRWDVRFVTDFSHLWHGAIWYTGRGLEQWDIGAAVVDSTEIYMEGLFQDCCHGAHQWKGDGSGWDTSKVVNAASMFRGSAAAVGMRTDRWNVSRLQNAAHMWDNATAFDQDLCAWSLPATADVTDMFRGTACPNPQDFVAGVAACHVCSNSSSSAMEGDTATADPFVKSSISDVSAAAAGTTTMTWSIWNIATATAATILLWSL